MASLVSNLLKIEGDETILALLAKMVSTDKSLFDFSMVLPAGEWGTRYNEEVSLRQHEGFLEYDFDTANSQSEPVTEALSVIFPELKFTHKWEQIENDFSGYCVYINGKLVERAYGNYEDYPTREDEDED